MDKEKQIGEMAKTLGIAFQLAGTTRFGEVAEVLVNAGYRKTSEVAEEIIRILRAAGITEFRYPIVAEIKKKYMEEEG